MLTENEQKILDDAPEGATHYKDGVYYKGVDGCAGMRFSKSWELAPAVGTYYIIAESLADLRKKQGKTVFDAVNHFEGESPNKSGSIIESIKSDPEYMDDLGSLHYSGLLGQDVDSEYYFLTCTIEEFNQCVDDLGKFANLPSLVGATEHDYEKHKNDYKEVKPRMNVEYIECNNLLEDLTYFNSMSTSEFYADTDGKHRINSTRNLALAYGKRSLYRKVETEIKTEKRWLGVIAKNGAGTTTSLFNSKEACESSFGSMYQIIEITVDV